MAIPGIFGTRGAAGAGPIDGGGATAAPGVALGIVGIAGRAGPPGIGGLAAAGAVADGGIVVPLLFGGGTLARGLLGTDGIAGAGATAPGIDGPGIDGRAATGGGGPPDEGVLIGRPIPTRAAGIAGCVGT